MKILNKSSKVSGKDLYAISIKVSVTQFKRILVSLKVINNKVERVQWNRFILAYVYVNVKIIVLIQFILPEHSMISYISKQINSFDS